MSLWGAGNPPIDSTAGIIAAPSTSDLIAELDSTQLKTYFLQPQDERNAKVTWICGASTTAIFQCEHVTSTAVDTSWLGAKLIWTPTGQSGQYVWNVRLGKDSRLRVRMISTAANAAASIQAEYLD